MSLIVLQSLAPPFLPGPQGSCVDSGIEPALLGFLPTLI